VLALAIVLAQSQPTTEAQVFGPIIGYFMASGVAGLIIILAMIGRIDLRPTTTQAQLVEYKALNTSLVAALTSEMVPTQKATVTALQVTAGELAAVRSELTALRLEVAKLRGGP